MAALMNEWNEQMNQWMNKSFIVALPMNEKTKLFGYSVEESTDFDLLFLMQIDNFNLATGIKPQNNLFKHRGINDNVCRKFLALL